MDSLYNISNELYTLLENGFTAEFLDEETGEIDEKKVAERIDALNIAFDDKVDSIACYIKDLSRLLEGIKAEKNALSERQKKVENKIERLKDYITNALVLNGKKKVVTARNEITYATSHPLTIYNEALLPLEYWRKVEDIKPDKELIKQAIKDGISVDGARIDDKLNLRIK